MDYELKVINLQNYENLHTLFAVIISGVILRMRLSITFLSEIKLNFSFRILCDVKFNFCTYIIFITKNLTKEYIHDMY